MADDDPDEMTPAEKTAAARQLREEMREDMRRRSKSAREAQERAEREGEE